MQPLAARWSIARQVVEPIVSMHVEPDARSTVTSELLLGETVVMLDASPGWSHVRAEADGYEGFVSSRALAVRRHDADHRVAARSTLLFPAADIKSIPPLRLPHGARLRLVTHTRPDTHGLVAVADGGFVHATHLVPFDRIAGNSPLALARSIYLGAPYLWGGRTPDGCDCSGLVQSVARACGHELPRDSGPQEAAIDRRVELVERCADDLVFWPGHVAIALDDDRVLHANAHTLSVAIEPLPAVIERAGPPSSVRRLAARQH